MTSRQTFVRHLFNGGWATDFGPTSDAVPDQGGILRLPFLTNAENIIFEFDGGPHKAPGTTRLNSSALESGADIKGLFDAWFTGASGSPAQHRIIHVGTTIKRDDADGTFTDLFTGLEADKVPDYTMFEDLLIIASDSTTDVPRSWDATTAQNLAGSPPNFAFSTTHKNRVWAAGDAANPSRLYYSVFLNGADWIGGGSGSIDIDPNDGDRITGIISHKNELWVFKGPYKGSIHRITGSAPTGGDPFARKSFLGEGLGAIGHNTLFRFGNDVGFMWSDGTIHSLAATAAFGDFNEAALSRPIHKYIREHFVFNRLEHAYAVNWDDFGFVLFSVPIDTVQQPNQILMMDYRFQGVRWGQWPAFSDVGVSLASVIDSTASDRRIIMGGGTDGFVRRLGQADRSIDGVTTINYLMTLPHLNYGSAFHLKTIAGGSIGIQPKVGDLTLGWTRDDNTQQTQTVTQGGGGVFLDTFVLDTDTLGGGRFVDRFFELEEGGEFRSISLEVSNNGLNEDVEIHSISAVIEPGSVSWENN